MEEFDITRVKNNLDNYKQKYENIKTLVAALKVMNSSCVEEYENMLISVDEDIKQMEERVAEYDEIQESIKLVDKLMMFD